MGRIGAMCSLTTEGVNCALRSHPLSYPAPPPKLRSEFCPMTTPKLASYVCTYVCWEI